MTATRSCAEMETSGRDRGRSCTEGGFPKRAQTRMAAGERHRQRQHDGGFVAAAGDSLSRTAGEGGERSEAG